MGNVHTLNFLEKRKVKRKASRRLGIIFSIVVLLLAITILMVRVPILATYRFAMEGKTDLESAQTALKEQRFAEAHDLLSKAQENFEHAYDRSRPLSFFKIFPGISRQYDAITNVLRVGIQIAKAGKTLSSAAERITEPLRKDGDVTYASISREEKHEFFKNLSHSEPDIQGAKADIDLASLFLEDIPHSLLLPPIAQAIQPIRNQLPGLQKVLDAALPAVQVIPSVVGYPEEKKYFFLLQNNNELRPTGGFIGTYGELTVRDGEVLSLKTDNIYNLDVRSEGFLKTTPPEPLQKYLQAKTWYLRDANWSPDFPTSAEKALELYNLETQSDHAFDGVIAITPTFIQNLLGLIGDITVDGVTFTKENVVDQLQYQVEVAFIQKGISDAGRKDIIGDLTETLFQRLLSLKKERWNDLIKVMDASIREKHVSMYLKNEESQRLVHEQQWDGALANPDGDYFSIIDANLASLKTDQVINRSIHYFLRAENDRVIATVRCTYTHNGTFDWKTTRYRTYTRVYVPKGSELISATGFFENDKLHGGKEAPPTTYEDLGKTVFGGFISIEPKEQRSIELTYQLPESIQQLYREGRYALYIQKQGGTTGHRLTLDVQAAGNIQSYSPAEGATADGKTFAVESDLRIDRKYEMNFSR